jgi:hypothetical protein
MRTDLQRLHDLVVRKAGCPWTSFHESRQTMLYPLTNCWFRCFALGSANSAFQIDAIVHGALRPSA